MFEAFFESCTGDVGKFTWLVLINEGAGNCLLWFEGQQTNLGGVVAIFDENIHNFFKFPW